MGARSTMSKADRLRCGLLYHFCRLQWPALPIERPVFDRHLERTFALVAAKEGAALGWTSYLERLLSLDWFLAISCLENLPAAWEALFASRIGRNDCLLVDALRTRAIRLYPRDEERQESAVAEFWSHLLVSETPGAVPVLARYDGLRPLVPWLVRVFQNWHISHLRQRSHEAALLEEDVTLPLPAEADARWHEAFCLAAREELSQLTENELLILGLRLRYRMSQREVANLLSVHEGTISRQTTSLSERFQQGVRKELLAQGWVGDDLDRLILTELGSLLLDDPRLSADALAHLLAKRKKSLPPSAKHR